MIRNIFGIILFILFSSIANAQSISVSPEKLDIALGSEPVTRNIFIYNGNAGELHFRVSAEGLGEIAEIRERTGTILPNSFQSATINFRPSGKSYSGSIIVSEETAEKPDVNIQLAAVIKTRVLGMESKDYGFDYGFAITMATVAIGSLGYLALRANPVLALLKP